MKTLSMPLWSSEFSLTRKINSIFSGVSSTSGCSLIDLNNVSRVFFVGVEQNIYSLSVTPPCREVKGYEFRIENDAIESLAKSDILSFCRD